MKFILGFLSAVALAALVGVAVVLSGAFNVAATDPHHPLVRWALDTNFERAVADKGNEVPPGPEPTEALLRTGFQEFDGVCVGCHGAPGVEPHDWSRDMRPHPPELSREATKWSREEIFWIIRHGVRMTGMPAFGPTHPDEELWAVASFVTTLPDMTAETYARLRAEAGEAGGHGHGGGQSGGSGQHDGGAAPADSAPATAAPRPEAGG